MTSEQFFGPLPSLWSTVLTAVGKEYGNRCLFTICHWREICASVLLRLISCFMTWAEPQLCVWKISQLSGTSAFWIADCCPTAVTKLQHMLMLVPVLVGLWCAQRTQKVCLFPHLFEAAMSSVPRKADCDSSTRLKMHWLVSEDVMVFFECGEDPCFWEALFQSFNCSSPCTGRGLCWQTQCSHWPGSHTSLQVPHLNTWCFRFYFSLSNLSNLVGPLCSGYKVDEDPELLGSDVTCAPSCSTVSVR